MLEEKVKYDDQGNIIEETVVNKAPQPNREPAYGGGHYLPNDRPQTFIPAQPTAPAVQDKQLYEDVLPAEAPQAESVAIEAPIKPPSPKTQPVADIQPTSDIDVKEAKPFKKTDFGIATATDAISKQMELAPTVELGQQEIEQGKQEYQAKLDELTQQKLAEQERNALAMSGKALPNESDTIGNRLLRGLFTFLGGVGLKAGQENQVFKYYMENAANKLKADTAKRAELMKKAQSPEDIEKAYLPRYKFLLDEFKAFTDSVVKKTGMTNSAIAAYTQIARESNQVNRTLNTNAKNQAENELKQTAEQRTIGLPAGEIMDTKKVNNLGKDAQRNAVRLPAKPHLSIILPDEKSAQLLRDDMAAFNMTNHLVEKMKELRLKYAGKPWDYVVAQMGFSEAAGFRRFMKEEFIRVGRLMNPLGVIQVAEAERILDGMPTAFNSPTDKFEGQMKALENEIYSNMTNKIQQAAPKLLEKDPKLTSLKTKLPVKYKFLSDEERKKYQKITKPKK